MEGLNFLMYLVDHRIPTRNKIPRVKSQDLQKHLVHMYDRRMIHWTCKFHCFMGIKGTKWFSQKSLHICAWIWILRTFTNCIENICSCYTLRLMMLNIRNENPRLLTVKKMMTSENNNWIKTIAIRM